MVANIYSEKSEVHVSYISWRQRATTFQAAHSDCAVIFKDPLALYIHW